MFSRHPCDHLLQFDKTHSHIALLQGDSHEIVEAKSLIQHGRYRVPGVGCGMVLERIPVRPNIQLGGQ